MCWLLVFYVPGVGVHAGKAHLKDLFELIERCGCYRDRPDCARNHQIDRIACALLIMKGFVIDVLGVGLEMK